MITVLFTDGDLNPVGQPVVAWTSIDLTVYFNQPDTVQVTLPRLPEYADLASPGNRLEIIRDGAFLTGGPIEYPGRSQWDSSQAALADPGVITIASTDDTVWLAQRLVYPDPANDATAQTAVSYTLSATNAETAMRDLVNLNAGPGALTDRQVPGLVLGSVAGVGTNVNVSARFTALSDELRAAAIAGGGLGYIIVRTGSSLEFRVYQPSDLSNAVRFSRGLANLRSYDYQPQAPTVTAAIVGGSGTGTSRTVVERTVMSPYGRIEQFVSNSASDTTTLDQAGDTALVNGGEKGQLTAYCVDTATQKFGVHYGLGDRVAVEIEPGIDVTDVVTAVRIIADQTGEVVLPQIGQATPSGDRVLVESMRDAFRRITYLETQT